MRAIGVVLAATAMVVGLATPAAAEIHAPSSAPDEEVGVTVDEAGEDDPCEAGGWIGRAGCAAVTGLGGRAVGSIVAGGANAVLTQFVGFVVEGATWLVDRVVEFIWEQTRPDLRSGWFADSYGDMALIALAGLLPFLVLAIIQALLRQDISMLLRVAFVYVPVAALGTGGAIVVVDMLVRLTDELSSWVARSVGDDLSGFAAAVGHALTQLGVAGSSVAGLAVFLGAGIVAFAAFVIWLELLLRQAAIYVGVLFLPLGFMALVWPATSHWLRRLAEGLVAIILSKFVIVAVMALAANALSADTSSEGYGTVISGGAMLSMAALAPYVLLRLIPVFEAGLSAQLEGTYRRPTAAVGSPVHPRSQIAGLVRQRAAARGTAAGVPVAMAGTAATAGTAGATVAGASGAARAARSAGARASEGVTTAGSGGSQSAPEGKGGRPSGAGETPERSDGGTRAPPPPSPPPAPPTSPSVSPPPSETPRDEGGKA